MTADFDWSDLSLPELDDLEYPDLGDLTVPDLDLEVPEIAVPEGWWRSE